MSPNPGWKGTAVTRGQLAIAMVVGLVVLVAAVWTVAVIDNRAQDENKAADAAANVSGCQRGNTNRYVNSLVQRELGIDLPGIATAEVDCRAGAIRVTGFDPGPVPNCYGPADRLPETCDRR